MMCLPRCERFIAKRRMCATVHPFHMDLLGDLVVSVLVGHPQTPLLTLLKHLMMAYGSNLRNTARAATALGSVSEYSLVSGPL